MSRLLALTRATPGRALALVGALGLVAFGLAGCGQKGPLYLPDKNGSVITRPGAAQGPAQTAPSSPAPKKKDDDSGSSAPK